MEEFVADTNHKSTSIVIGRLCEKCKEPIKEGDQVVTRLHHRVYHRRCWRRMFL